MTSSDSHVASGLPARKAAFEVLEAILGKKQTLDNALDRATGKHKLSASDRRFVHALCATCLRHLPECDLWLNQIMKRSVRPDPPALYYLLLMGITQLVWLDVAPHAAIYTTVSLAGSCGVSRQKSLVNAVLRTVQRRMDAGDLPVLFALDRLPSWLRDSWIGHYGQARAECIAETMLMEAPVDISLKVGSETQYWAQMLQADTLYDGQLRVMHQQGHVTDWPGYLGGEWWVQDISSSMPINALGDIHGKILIDLCAAPGGKTLQAMTRGARVTAIDQSGARLERLKQNIDRVSKHAPVDIIVSNALDWMPDDGADIVLLDAPCSSTGTLRRHPELGWIRGLETVLTLCDLQARLLDHASKMVKLGGVLVYATCSMQPEEGEFQVQQFLAKNNNFKELVDIPDVLRSYLSRGVSNCGWRIYPHTLREKGGADGFYLALLKHT